MFETTTTTKALQIPFSNEFSVSGHLKSPENDEGG
jgi:hypothetical protein